MTIHPAKTTICGTGVPLADEREMCWSKKSGSGPRRVYHVTHSRRHLRAGVLTQA